MTLNTETAERAVDSAMAEIADFDLRIEGAAQGMPKAGSLSYIARHRHEYVRTVRDINEFRPPAGHVRVLELGAFFGVNCLALKKLGYDAPCYLPSRKVASSFSVMPPAGDWTSRTWSGAGS